MALKKTVPRNLSLDSSNKPAANGGKAKSASVIVKTIDQVNMGSRFHVTPLARFLTMVVRKLIEPMVTENENSSNAITVSVIPACEVNCIVFRGA